MALNQCPGMALSLLPLLARSKSKSESYLGLSRVARTAFCHFNPSEIVFGTVYLGATGVGVGDAAGTVLDFVVTGATLLKDKMMQWGALDHGS